MAAVNHLSIEERAKLIYPDNEYLQNKWIDAFNVVCDKVAMHRISLMKTPGVECIVTESDWPIYEQVKKLLLNQINDKEEHF